MNLPKNRTRQRKLLLWTARNCRREAERPRIDPARADDLLRWADAADFHLKYKPAP